MDETQNWPEIVAAKDQKIAELELQNQWLLEQLKLSKQRLFGSSSEKSAAIEGGEQLSVFNEAEATADPAVAEPALEQVAAHTRKKPKGKREEDFSGLPVEQVVHELSEEERVCADCGGPMHACGHEVYRRELTVVPPQFKVTEHVQTAYSCRHCEKSAEDDPVPMLKSAVPAPVIRGSGVASPSLLAYIAHQKYVLALPLYRQEQEFKRLGLNLPRHNMANWMIYVSANYFRPIYDAMKAELLTHEVLHGDDTGLQVLREPGKTPQSGSYMWLYRTSGDAARHVVYYEYQPDHKERRPADFLDGWSGYLHTDGYKGYHKLKNVTVIGCWAHVRRRFANVLKTIPAKARAGSESLRGLQFCDRLFALEREYAKLPPDDNFKARYKARLELSKPVMVAFFEWAKNSPALPQSGVGEAISYAQNQRFWLEKVLLDGRLELSNNRAERSVKPFTIGRHNWLFADTVGGANASAVLYSVIETAKENGLYPFDYLEFVFQTAPGLDFRNDPAVLDRLMPWNAPPGLRRVDTPSKALPWDVI
jgi:transposase